MRWTIYNNEHIELAVIEDLELHDEWMAESYLTVTVKSAVPIDFSIGDYIDYRGTRYVIDYDPSVIKKARRGSYGEGFVYDNIKFADEAQSKLVRCDFTDIVLNDNELHYTALPTFPFYCQSVDDLLDRIQACLEDLYPGEFVLIGMNTERNHQRGTVVGREAAFVAAYKRYVDPDGAPNTEPYGSQSVALSVDNIGCWDALSKVHSDFGLNFIIRDYVVVVGTAGSEIAGTTFRYGKGNGLYEIERVTDNSEAVVTRLRAYGNETNLPTRYYANLNLQVYGIAAASGDGLATLDIDFRKDYFTNDFSSGETRVTLRIGDTEYPDAVAYNNATNGKIIVNTRTMDPITIGDRVYFTSGVNEDAWPTGYRDYATDNLPNNMAVSRLMLPGFPNQSLQEWVAEHRSELIEEGFSFSVDPYRPFIDSPNADIYGIRPSSIYFDGSDDTDDIYPTITGMKHGGVAIDEIYDAEQIDDNGVYGEGSVPNFTITLPDLGFDLSEVWNSGASISMKDGMCGGRSFEIAAKPTQDADGRWVCVCKRDEDSALELWFPYEDFQIHRGDHYVLVGIDMPDAYIEAASERLFDAAIEALRKNHAPRFTWQPRIDELWMQRQHDAAESLGEQSIHDTLRAGDIFPFEDADLGIEGAIIIDVLTIKENGNNGIPTYDVTLRDEKTVGTIQKIQNKVDSLANGGNGVRGGGGSGYTSKQIRDLITRLGGENFLSKLTDDVAEGVITFVKGLWVKAKGLFGIDEEGNGIFNNVSAEGDAEVTGDVVVGGDATIDGDATVGGAVKSDDFVPGDTSGSGWAVYSQGGVSTIEIDKLYVRMKAVFNELEVKKRTYSGGNIVFSDAGNVIVDAYPVDLYGNKTDSEHPSAYRCLWEVSDGDRAVDNDWAVGDQARCQTFNIKEGYHQGVSNRYYWRKVLGCGITGSSGSYHNYVDLAADVTGTYGGATYTNGMQTGVDNDIPAAGDNIVQMGCQDDTKPERQNVMEITVNGTEAPASMMYKGVNDYTFTGKLIRGDYYDPVAGTYKSITYGDWYVGSRDGSSQYAKYDSNQNQLEIKAKVKVLGGSDLGEEFASLSGDVSGLKTDVGNLNEGIDDLSATVDGLDTTVSNLGTQRGNLLRNTSFTGDYESERVSEQEDVNGSTVIFSDPLKHWVVSGTVEQFATVSSASGYAARLNNGASITQILTSPLSSGADYIVSFRAKTVSGSATVRVQMGPESSSSNLINESVSVTSALKRYDVRLKPSTGTINRFRLLVASAAVEVMEVQLMQGNIPTAWQPSFMDNNRAMGDYYAMRYLREALVNGNTEIIGGLVLSSIFKVGLWRDGAFSQETGGLSGVYNDGDSPLLWGGGSMAQAAATITAYASDPTYQPTASELANMAKVVITHGGRAILHDVVLRGYVYAEGGEFRGTVRASNFFHSICQWGAFDDQTLYYCTSTADYDMEDYASAFVVGRYYTGAEVYARTAADIDLNGSSASMGFVACTGAADIVIVASASSNRTVRLPHPADFEGKIVEVIDSAYEAADNAKVSCVVNPSGTYKGFAIGVDTGGPTGGGATLSTVTLPLNGKSRFLAMKHGANYWWLQLE